MSLPREIFLGSRCRADDPYKGPEINNVDLGVHGHSGNPTFIPFVFPEYIVGADGLKGVIAVIAD